MAKKGHIPWNKGKKIKETHPQMGFKSGNTHGEHPNAVATRFQKGTRPSPETEFKKGQIPNVEKRRSYKGEGNPAWKGGVTELAKLIRHSDKYAKWRLSVFERDEFTCIECGKNGGILHADHITPFFFILAKNMISSFEDAAECEELWDITNGQTLCVPCHKKTDTYLSKAKEYYQISKT